MELIENIEELLRRVTAAGGIVQAMREGERSIGAMIVEPDSRSWLPSSDWGPHPIVSIKDGEVRIVAIMANVEGIGAFSALINGIVCEDLKPVVIEPMFKMLGILGRWGWTETIQGEGRSRERQWRPTREWIRKRRKNLGCGQARRRLGWAGRGGARRGAAGYGEPGRGGAWQGRTRRFNYHGDG